MPDREGAHGGDGDEQVNADVSPEEPPQSDDGDLVAGEDHRRHEEEVRWQGLPVKVPQREARGKGYPRQGEGQEPPLRVHVDVGPLVLVTVMVMIVVIVVVVPVVVVAVAYPRSPHSSERSEDGLLT